MRTIAIIPARGGSKRIPRKNIKDFLGAPILSYAIQLALESNLFTEVMVSTDDEEIAAIAREYGAKVPFLRTQTNASDKASTFAALREVLQKYMAEGKSFDSACCIYPCTPLLRKRHLEEASNLLQTDDYEVVFPVVPYAYPIQRAMSVNGGKISFLQQINALKRTQDLEQAYHDAGQFYFFKVDEILKGGELISPKAGAVILNPLEVQDIDNLDDWKLAELKFQMSK